jgi:cupin 2 domain-containing protein
VTTSPAPVNLLGELPRQLAAEEILPLFSRNGLRIERIVSTGQTSPPGFWYDQDEDEWVLVLRGWGRIDFTDGTSITLHAGEALTIPARCRHRVAATAVDEPTVWLAVFYAPG